MYLQTKIDLERNFRLNTARSFLRQIFKNKILVRVDSSQRQDAKHRNTVTLIWSVTKVTGSERFRILHSYQSLNVPDICSLVHKANLASSSSVLTNQRKCTVRWSHGHNHMAPVCCDKGPK
ncbi:unnamed protein product [Lymnaea stagnalis]|uniref:Uncharacterized protein n=1 Tax=Lymnaea stagnalis TaxID=6523 RepID=A0AAV2HRH9_LYMST